MILYTPNGIYTYADDYIISRHGDDIVTVKILLEEATHMALVSWPSVAMAEVDSCAARLRRSLAHGCSHEYPHYLSLKAALLVRLALALS